MLHRFLTLRGKNLPLRGNNSRAVRWLRWPALLGIALTCLFGGALVAIFFGSGEDSSRARARLPGQQIRSEPASRAAPIPPLSGEDPTPQVATSRKRQGESAVRGEPRRAAPPARRKPARQLRVELANLVARRDEFHDTRAYWERFEQLKRDFVASGSESVPLLEENLLSTDAPPRLRRASVGLLGAMKSDRSIPVLAEVLRDDPDDEVRRLAARALAEYRPSPRVHQILVDELLRGESFSGSYAVVFSLSEFKDPRDVQLFQHLATNHDDVSVRIQAVHALGRYEDREMIPFLLSVARNDPHRDPRDMAAQVVQDLER
jgi:HEAT repeat protein